MPADTSRRMWLATPHSLWDSLRLSITHVIGTISGRSLNGWWNVAAAAVAKSLQSCPTLCDPTRLPHPWDPPGKSTGVGCHCQISPPGCQDHEVHSSWRDLIWAQETPWTEEPGGLQSMGSQKSRTQISYYTTTTLVLIFKAVSFGSVSPLKTSGGSRGCQRNILNHEVCSRLEERVPYYFQKEEHRQNQKYAHSVTG